MTKPIVFLSHSSKDKQQLVALKTLLDIRAVRSLEFFLSSDGQSIKFGTNWVVRISDALAQAQMMFVFLSPNSIDSKWIHFEAGCAYAKNVEVVPVCLPGTLLTAMQAPLSLLQGFNLHSHDAMGNIVRMCNEKFDLKMPEDFSAAEFQGVFAPSILQTAQFFGEFSWAIEVILLKYTSDELSEAENFDPSDTIEKLCGTSGVRIITDSQPNQTNIELPGCHISIDRTLQVKRGKPPNPNTRFKLGIIECQLTPELYDMNSVLLDQWHTAAGLKKRWNVEIKFKRNVFHDQARYKVTSKLHNSGIHAIDLHKLDFDGLQFELTDSPTYGNSSIELKSNGNFSDKRLAKVITKLFEQQVLYLREAVNE